MPSSFGVWFSFELPWAITVREWLGPQTTEDSLHCCVTWLAVNASFHLEVLLALFEGAILLGLGTGLELFRVWQLSSEKKNKQKTSQDQVF